MGFRVLAEGGCAAGWRWRWHECGGSGAASDTAADADADNSNTKTTTSPPATSLHCLGRPRRRNHPRRRRRLRRRGLRRLRRRRRRRQMPPTTFKPTTLPQSTEPCRQSLRAKGPRVNEIQRRLFEREIETTARRMSESESARGGGEGGVRKRVSEQQRARRKQRELLH